MRRMCEAYPGLTPCQIEAMTIDQVRIMSTDEKLLAGRGAVKYGSVAELERLGIIPPQGGRSLAQIAEERMAEHKRVACLLRKRARRDEQSATIAARSQDGD